MEILCRGPFLIEHSVINKALLANMEAYKREKDKLPKGHHAIFHNEKLAFMHENHQGLLDHYSYHIGDYGGCYIVCIGHEDDINYI